MRHPVGLSIVIPCLNEAETITAAVREAHQGLRRADLPGEVIVADNGSTDHSPRLAEAAGARVVHVHARRGYGAAVHGGVQEARYAYVGFADADLSYPLADFADLLQPLVEGRADFVLGSRLRGTIETEAMPTLNRYLGTPVLSFLLRWLIGIPTSDCNSGMRVFKRDVYERLDLRCPGMEYASEMLVRVAKTRSRYVELPISFRKDQRNKPPHLRRWRDGWRHMTYILRHSFTVVSPE